MAKPYDPTLKVLVDTNPADWVSLIEARPTVPVSILNVELTAVQNAVDYVLRIHRNPDELMHWEFHAGHTGAALPRRLHRYNAWLDDDYDLPVQSVAVLLRPEADAPELTGRFVRRRGKQRPHVSFRYKVIRVWQMSAPDLLQGGLATLPLAPISQVSKSDVPQVIAQMKQRLAQPSAQPVADELWGATQILLGLRFSPQDAVNLLRGVRSMKESSTYQAILEEGRQEGLVTGHATGVVEGMRKLLLHLGTKRWGEPGKRAQDALIAIADVARLEELAERVFVVQSWHELLGLPAPRKRKRPS